MKGWKSRIATTLLAAAFIGSTAVSAATLYYENTKLVEENGQPVAKIVVGSGAALSDGIAAANIAAAIAQNAYARSALNVRLQGTPACTVSGAGTGTGAGTCEVTDKKVTIEITVPGQLANAHQFKTLITDSIDKSLGNRMNTLPEDLYDTTLTLPDTSLPRTVSPLRGLATFNGNLYMIGKDQFNGFDVPSAKDEQATSGFTYVQEPAFWVGSAAPSSGVYYDLGTDYHQVVARPNALAYSLRFLGNDWGIPVCTVTNVSGEWAGCTADGVDRTARHRLKVNFLGADWVISSMTPPTTNVTASSSVLNGGEIKLAKEADYRIISIGESIDAGTFKVRLADISVAVGSTNTHPAIIDVLDSNDQVIGQIQVTPGDTYTFTQSSTGSSIKVHVYQTAGGLTLSAKWAEIAIYTDEIKLTDGHIYNDASSSDPVWGYVYTQLLWKTKDWSSTNQAPNSLREIVLYVSDVQGYMNQNDRMKAGDSVVFPLQDPVYRLTYNGLDLADSERTSLRYDVVNSGRISVANSDNCNILNGSWSGTFIHITSDTDSAFGGSSSDMMGQYRAKDFYVDPMGNFTYSNSTNQQNQSSWNLVANNTVSQIFFKQSPTCKYLSVANFTSTKNENAGGVSASLTGYTNAVKYDSAGDDASSPALGLIKFYFDGYSASLNSTLNASYASLTTTTSPAIIGEIVLQENAGRLNATTYHHDLLRIPVYNITNSNWQFQPTSATTAYVYYNGLNLSNATADTVLAAAGRELPFYSERGTKVNSVGLTGVSFSVAKRVANAQFTFATASTAAGKENTETWIAKEGDTKTLSNGVGLLVKAIDQTVGACTAGGASGAPTCTATMGTVTGVADPAVTSVLTPYTGDLKMVIKDSEAAGVSGTLITVGGSVVNSVTKEAASQGDANIDFNKDNVVVKVVGNKIVVAGLTADDTMTAANSFISKLKTQ